MKRLTTILSTATLSLALSSAGCVSIPEGNGNVDHVPMGSCKNVALCSVLPLARVNDVLGDSFESPTGGSSADGGLFGDSCAYTKPQTIGLFITRGCFLDGQSASSQYASLRADPLLPPESHTDVPGVGDEAFVDTNVIGPDHMEETLEVHEGNVLVRIDDGGIPVDESTLQGLSSLPVDQKNLPRLVELANMILAQ